MVDQGQASEKSAEAIRVKSYFVRATGITCLMVVIIGVFWVIVPSEVPLYYSKPWGESRLASKGMLLVLPGLALTTIIINAILTKFTRSDYHILTTTLAAATIVVSVMLVFSLFGIMWSIL